MQPASLSSLMVRCPVTICKICNLGLNLSTRLKKKLIMPEAITVSGRPVLDQHTMHHAPNRMDMLLAMRLEGLHRMTNLSCVKWKRKLLFAGRLISHADQVGRGHYLMCLPAL